MRVVNELGWDIIEFEAANNTQIEQGMRKVADRGATLNCCYGFCTSRRSSCSSTSIIQILTLLMLMFVG